MSTATDTPVITSESIAAWMQQQLNKVHQSHEYGDITIQINQTAGRESPAKFSIYTGTNSANFFAA